MKTRLLPLIIAMAMVACSNSWKPDKFQTAFINEFPKQLHLPLKIDTVFIANLDTLEAMDLPFLQNVLNDSIKTELAGDLKSTVEGCVLIEKLKQSGRYAGYLDSLDIGMLKNAMAFKIGKVMMENKRPLLLWGINETSYEACPFFSGTSIIASYPNMQKGFTHVVVACRYQAGDPPEFMKRVAWTQLEESHLRIVTTLTNEDTDTKVKNTETKFILLGLQNGDLAVEQKAEVK